MPKNIGMPPRGIGLAMTLITMLAGFGLIALFFTYVLPLFESIPYGTLYFALAFLFAYLTVALLIWIVGNAAKRQIIQYA